jgi:glycosyltransferase involved in cell wall biosynthesis
VIGSRRVQGVERLNLHIFLSGIESETRLFKEARYTIEQGIFSRVVVLGTWGKGLERREVTEYGLEILREPLLIRHFAGLGFLRRLPLLSKLMAAFSMAQFLAASVLQARRLKPSHVSCHNAMLLPTAWVAARLSGARLVYVPHELETHRAGLGAVMRMIEGAAEGLLLKAHTPVVVVCDPIAEWYRDTYGLTNVHVARNVPERMAVETRPAPSGGFRARFNIPESATIFIYQGMFGKARGTDRLLEIFSRLAPEAAHLILMGFGEEADHAEIDTFVARCRNIHYQPAVSREWIISYTTGADVGLLAVESTPLSYRYALPNKFFEYAHAGVPMLVSNNFELLSKIINDESIGWSSPYSAVEALILELTKTDLAPYRARALEFAGSAVWEADAKVFATVYES